VAVSASTQAVELSEAVPAGAAATVRATRSEAQPELDDHYLVALAKRGSADAYDRLIRRYRGFVRLKASSYFLLGGDADDLIQEGTVGLYKAIRDYRTDRESSFRNFAELCITRQIITAVKTASRNKHAPLNQYVSFAQSPAASGDSDTTLEEVLPGPISDDPADRVIASEELSSLVDCLGDVLSELESQVLSLYLDGYSYEVVAERLECDTKTVDNALQRVKRKVSAHISAREVLL
jgi:RNA polymerase sporulation-specific sigma factor